MATYPATVPTVNKYPEMLSTYGIGMLHHGVYYSFIINLFLIIYLFIISFFIIIIYYIIFLYLFMILWSRGNPKHG